MRATYLIVTSYRASDASNSNKDVAKKITELKNRSVENGIGMEPTNISIDQI